MSCVALQKVIFHSHSRTVFTGGLWCVVNMVSAASEVTNRDAADAVDVPQWLMSPVSMGPVLC